VKLELGYVVGRLDEPDQTQDSNLSSFDQHQKSWFHWCVFNSIILPFTFLHFTHHLN
jgi:hypothetical protein